MATMVHVILSGIVSLVQQQDGSYLVRMQDARQSAHTVPHFSSILAESPHVTTAPLTDPAAARPEGNPLYKAWRLANGTLEIQGAPTQGLMIDENIRDVLTISNACPGDRRCAIMKRAFNGVELVVRGGKLQTSGHEPYRWYFSNQQPSDARRPAEEITWSFAIAAPPLRLSVPVLHNGETRQVEFTVQAPPNEDIEIRLQNAPEPDLIPRPEDPPPSRDQHVALYFELSTQRPDPPVELLRDKDTPPQREQPSHRLSGRRIVERLERPPQPGRAEQTVDFHVVRVNCPPSLWDSLEPPPQ